MSKLKIISHAERVLKGNFVKVAIFGPPGIGKTSLLKTLDQPTLCIDLEAGMLSVQDWQGDTISVRTWEEARSIACLLGGPNPALGDRDSYSQKHYDRLCKEYGEPSQLDKYSCIFIDSMTVASRLCFKWAQLQPECINKYGKVDTWSVYGLLAREMTAWITQLQHIKDKDIVMLGLLDKDMDDQKNVSWTLQCEGRATKAEMPGILDAVLCMVASTNNNGDLHRIFVTGPLNPQGYPAKDRSGKLSLYEEAHLGNVLKKMKSVCGYNNPDMFVFVSKKGSSRAYHKDKVKEYLLSNIEKITKYEHLETFDAWLNDNKDVLDRYKKSCQNSYDIFVEILDRKRELLSVMNENPKNAEVILAYDALIPKS